MHYLATIDVIRHLILRICTVVVFNVWLLNFSPLMQGLCMTSLILGIVRRALPALPISIFFGLLFYFSSQYLIAPFASVLATTQVIIWTTLTHSLVQSNNVCWFFQSFPSDLSTLWSSSTISQRLPSQEVSNAAHVMPLGVSLLRILGALGLERSLRVPGSRIHRDALRRCVACMTVMRRISTRRDAAMRRVAKVS